MSGNNSVSCSGCLAGFSLDAGSNQCLEICGDSLLVGAEECDDGNSADGDGCSSACAVETSFFCQGTPSACYPCLQHCLDCPDNSSCANCSALTAYDPSVPACLANCSAIGSCLTCNVSASASGEFVECLSCSGGYSVDPASNSCRPICGDGILAPEEACEDGNTLGGDGCGPSCLVEPHFACNTSAASNLSECSLVDFGLSFSHLIKHSGANSGSMHFDPSPAGLPIYEQVDWAAALSSPDPNIQVTGARYDPASGKVVLDFSYDSTVSQPEIQVALSTSSSPTLSSVASFAVAAAAKASNNAALVFYEDSEYGMAKIAQYLAIGLGVAALLLFVAGLFGGRLIGLECLALVQLSFLCLLSLEDLSATLSELQYLRFSFGYNSLAAYDYGQGLGRPFVAAQLSRPLVLNFNISAGLILVPLIAALVFKIASARAADQARKEAWLQRAKYAAG